MKVNIKVSLLGGDREMVEEEGGREGEREIR